MTAPVLSDGMWMEHPDSIMRRAPRAAARNPVAVAQIAEKDSAVLRAMVEKLGAQGGREADDVRVLLHAELVRRVRDEAEAA